MRPPERWREDLLDAVVLYSAGVFAMGFASACLLLGVLL